MVKGVRISEDGIAGKEVEKTNRSRGVFGAGDDWEMGRGSEGE